MRQDDFIKALLDRGFKERPGVIPSYALMCKSKGRRKWYCRVLIFDCDAMVRASGQDFTVAVGRVPLERVLPFTDALIEVLK